MFRVPYLPLLAVPLLALSACSGPGELFTAPGTESGGASGASTSGGAGGALAIAGAGARPVRAAAGAGGSAGGNVTVSPNPTVQGGAGGAPQEQPSGGAGSGPTSPPSTPMVGPLQVEGVCKGKVVSASASIDDFEQGMNGWATYIDDQVGAPSLSSPGAALSEHAATFSGGAADVSGVYRDLRCTDVSAFTGISFWAKGRGGDHVRFLAVIPATQPQAEGGDCDAARMTCWDHPGKLFELSDQWQQYRVAWKDLAQYGWGTPATFAGVLNALLWINDGPVDSFEFALDGIELYASDAP